MREIIAFPTALNDQYHRSSTPRNAIIPVVADSALDAVHLITAAYLLACCDTQDPHQPFRLSVAARESLTLTLDPDDNNRVLAIQDSAGPGFLWVDGFGIVIDPERADDDTDDD